MLALIALLVLAVLFNVALGFLERFLAKKPKKVYGLIMPFFFLIIAIMSMLTSIEQTFTQLLTVDSPLAAVLVLLVLFLLLNITTIVTYVVYFRTRRRMGERPWPLRPLPPSDDRTDPPTE